MKYLSLFLFLYLLSLLNCGTFNKHKDPDFALNQSLLKVKSTPNSNVGPENSDKDVQSSTNKNGDVESDDDDDGHEGGHRDHDHDPFTGEKRPPTPPKGESRHRKLRRKKWSG